ncbi:hypothetical protein [Bosea rubneri]|uniref:Uncharacterized protein n=1 Tax=Bosea rubneri TaxID=3075434 RepID=A0ABU3S985_9HYPH|nr:hypothetical protein [Bosea sp. ZW T0_25]MDU0341342.1 hypothetical protein [Bosea sp. ZW T0_25]
MSRRGGGGGAPDHQARYNIGALEQRVYGLEQGVAGLSNQMSGLSQQIAARGKTNWTVIIGFGDIALSFMIAIGGMAYWPIRETQSDMKATIAKLTDLQAGLGERFVSIRELDARSSRTRQDIDRLNTDFTALDVTSRRSMEQGDANLQRQIDDQKKAFGETYSLRDAMQQFRRELDELRKRAPP